MDANPVETLYQRLHQIARQATHPTIAQNNLATGVGKSYWALHTSADALVEAKEAGESLVIVYVAPSTRTSTSPIITTDVRHSRPPSAAYCRMIFPASKSPRGPSSPTRITRIASTETCWRWRTV